MLKRYMHNRERYFISQDNNRIVRPFEWGTEFVSENNNTENPRQFFSELAKNTVAESDKFFALTEAIDFDVRGNDLTWQSAVLTNSAENNVVRAKFFPYEKNKRSAVVILPHWNAKPETYFALARLFNKVGVSAFRLTLPYHEERRPPQMERADYLVAPNIGLTLQSIKQAVLDTKASVQWLKKQGYEKIGLVGTSVGSCIGFLAFVHELQIDGAVFNHVSNYVADVVWKGLTTHHVRESLEKEISLEELREYWSQISPASYMTKLAAQKPRSQKYIYTLYDLSFPVELSRNTIKSLREHKIKHSKTTLPCGHYTLGESPWKFIDGYKIVSFLKWHLR
ncbi:MAG TPA: hypothetical protein PKY82_12630 [Pyrinomonadaceae bacterium]|nr:hypothetical protein [Pyrinomonadaceae bacterium]